MQKLQMCLYLLHMLLIRLKETCICREKERHMTANNLCCAEYADVLVNFHIHAGAVAVSGFYFHSKHLRYCHEIRGSMQIDVRTWKETPNFTSNIEQTIHHSTSWVKIFYPHLYSTLVFEGRQVCSHSVLTFYEVKRSARFWLSILHLLPNREL